MKMSVSNKQIVIDEALHTRLKVYASAKKKQIKEIVSELITDFLRENIIVVEE